MKKMSKSFLLASAALIFVLGAIPVRATQSAAASDGVYAATTQDGSDSGAQLSRRHRHKHHRPHH
jgi:hypothetical protein